MEAEMAFEAAYLVNIEAEQNVLGSLIMEPELIKDCWLEPENFGEQRHSNLFYVMRDLDEHGKPIDVVAIVERVGKSKIDKIGGVGYLSDLAGSIPTTANFNFYQTIVFEHWQKRKTHEAGRDVMKGVIEGDVGQVIQEGIDTLMSLQENKADDDDGNIKDALVELYDEMEQDRGEITGIPSGYNDLDRMTGGWQPQDLIIVAARPSVGKTAFALNMGLNAADHDKRPPGELGDVVGIFSLEMGKKQLLKRYLSNIGNIDATKMRNAQRYFKDGDWQKLTMGMGMLTGLNLHIFDTPGMRMNEIWSKCRKLRRTYQDRNILIIIDYLQLIIGNPKHGGNRNQEVSEISRSLKTMARELNVSVIALSQLSRGVESRQDKRPMMSDIRDSGQIEQDADVIAFLYRDDYYDKESEKQNIIEIIIAKQRNGPIGTVELAFIKEYNKFVNLDRRHNE